MRITVKYKIQVFLMNPELPGTAAILYKDQKIGRQLILT